MIHCLNLSNSINSCLQPSPFWTELEKGDCLEFEIATPYLYDDFWILSLVPRKMEHIYRRNLVECSDFCCFLCELLTGGWSWAIAPHTHMHPGRLDSRALCKISQLATNQNLGSQTSLWLERGWCHLSLSCALTSLFYITCGKIKGLVVKGEQGFVCA